MRAFVANNFKKKKKNEGFSFGVTTTIATATTTMVLFPLPPSKDFESASNRASKAKDVNNEKRQLNNSELANKGPKIETGSESKKNKVVIVGSEVFIPYWQLMTSTFRNDLYTALIWMRTLPVVLIGIRLREI